jgi:hypothetical protein
MCAERVTRILTAFMLVIIMGFLAKGMQMVALVLLAFMAIMMTIWALFDFCPSIWMMRKILPSCYCPCEEKESNG